MNAYSTALETSCHLLCTFHPKLSPRDNVETSWTDDSTDARNEASMRKVVYFRRSSHTHTQEPHVTTQRLLEYIGLQFGLGKCVVNPNLRPATTSSNIQIIRTNRFSLTSTVAKRPKTSPAVFKDDMEM